MFLSLGSVLGVMTQMERVTAIPVTVTEVQPGAARVQRGKIDIVGLTARGITFNGKAIDKEELAAKVAGKNITLRADRTLTNQTTFMVLAELVRSGANLSIEVIETNEHGTHGGE